MKRATAVAPENARSILEDDNVSPPQRSVTHQDGGDTLVQRYGIRLQAGRLQPWRSRPRSRYAVRRASRNDSWSKPRLPPELVLRVLKHAEEGLKKGGQLGRRRAR